MDFSITPLEDVTKNGNSIPSHVIFKIKANYDKSLNIKAHMNSRGN